MLFKKLMSLSKQMTRDTQHTVEKCSVTTTVHSGCKGVLWQDYKPVYTNFVSGSLFPSGALNHPGFIFGTVKPACRKLEYESWQVITHSCSTVKQGSKLTSPTYTCITFPYQTEWLTSVYCYFINKNQKLIGWKKFISFSDCHLVYSQRSWKQ